MLQPFMSPVGEGQYIPSACEAEDAFYLLDEYLGARLASDQSWLRPDNHGPTITLEYEGIQLAKIGSQYKPNGSQLWTLLTDLQDQSRYRCHWDPVSGKPRVSRVDQPCRVARALDALAEVTAGVGPAEKVRNGIIEKAFNNGVFRRLIVGKKETEALIEHLGLGTPIDPRTRQPL